MNKHKKQSVIDLLYLIFDDNMKFLLVHDKELHDRVDALSEAINSSVYEPRFHLEYIESNNEFDIFDDTSKRYLYSRKPSEFNKKSVDSINFSMANSINFINPNPYSCVGSEDSDLESEKILYKTNSHMQSFSKYFTLDPFRNSNRKQKYFNKFIFIGTLLGRHIIEIAKKIKSLDYLICENSLEIFRLSLFVCSYHELHINCSSITFSIMDDESKFLEKLEAFYSRGIFFNTVYKYFSTGYDSKRYIDNILNFVYTKDPFVFSYTRSMDALKKTSIIFNKEYFFSLDDLCLIEPGSFLCDKSVLLLGAGPTIGKNIDWICKNKTKFVVVAIAASLGRLAYHGIVPDIIITLDSDKIILEQFDVGEQYYKNSIIIASSMTHPAVIDKIKKVNSSVYFFEILNTFTKSKHRLSGYSVSEYALTLLLMMQIKNIYLLGIDLALDQLSGKTHDEMHHEAFKVRQFEIPSNSSNDLLLNGGRYSLREELIQAQGNLINSVYTSRVFAISGIAMSNVIACYKKDFQNIYNLSSDGLFIEGAIPTKLEKLFFKIDTVEKNNFHDDLNGYLFDLNEILRNKNKCKISYENNIQTLDFLLDTLKKSKELKYKNFPEFETASIEFFKMSCLKMNMDLAYVEILSNFYFSVLRYLQFAMNDISINIAVESDLVENIKNTWADILYEVISEYKIIISDALAWH